MKKSASKRAKAQTPQPQKTEATAKEISALSPRVAWKAIAALGALVFLMFADMLIAPGHFVLGNQTADMFSQFFSWREFGFGQLAHGNLALWNPHVYGGAPYFGGIQGALLCPTNIPLLFLPLPLAINWSIALNVWLLGAFMYLWAAYRGLKPLACFAAGVLVMFCGPHFIHLYSGHLVNLATMTWAPLIFLAIDGIFGLATNGNPSRLPGWCLLGMFAVCMQVFAGHPQYLFYTGIAAGLYTLLCAAQASAVQWGSRPPGKVLLSAFVVPSVALAGIFAGGATLAAVQLFTAVQATGETIRSAQVPFEFASMFGFPPENLLTLLNPFFFGDMTHQVYWGRCYLWEMSLFIGVTGLVLAAFGAMCAKAPRFPAQKTWILTAMVGLTFLLALGNHTPLFRILYEWAPGFSKFRGISKFTFQMALFLVMLAATGLDALLRKPQPERRFVFGVAIAGGLVLLMAGWIGLSSAVDWQGWLQAIQNTRECYLSPAALNDVAFVDKARTFAASALLLPGFTLLAIAGLLHYAPSRRQAIPLLALLLVVETFFFAWHTRDTFDSRLVATPEIKDFIQKHPGDYRILNLLNPNSALSLGAQDLWGNDPGVVRRYCEFMSWTQGIPPENATQYISFQKLDPLYAMLRLRYAFLPDQQGVRIVESPAKPMERLQLVSRCQVIAQRDDIFIALRSPGFDPRSEVILETPPAVEPVASSNPGTARVTASSTDWLEVEADAASPAILLLTDIYTPAWLATALPGSSQSQYQLMPANYTLRAVPLAAGHHRLRIEYAPQAFAIGKWVSAGAWLAFAGAVFVVSRQRRRQTP